ncbi:hypothetical protein CASFOL_032456 [Castilleja foliolosa]|uniref:CCHC-type domain-containing protein n=1 Tax=Castilleja foliolosa TaxID=1961234 RepID=A0ABD3C1I1_9LAMI
MMLCYLCSEAGHRKTDCPLNPQLKGRRKSRRDVNRLEKTVQLQSEMSKESRKKQPPLLLTIHKQAKQSIYNPLESQTHTMCIPVLVDKIILASTHGWLVLVSEGNEKCSLWNPGSNAMIELPSLQDYYLYQKCVLSKPPTEPDCHILFNSTVTLRQAFCKIGDVEFTYQCQLEEDYQLIAIASFQGKIYGVMNPGYKFVTIEFVGTTMELRPMLINEEKPWKAPQPDRNWVVWHENEFVDSPSGNELFLVVKDSSNDSIMDGSEIRVFRVDINRMECVEVDDIGDQVILMGYYGTGFCCSSFAAIKPNSICYTTDEGAYVYVYDLDDKSTSSWLPHDVGLDVVNHFWVDLELEDISL